MKYRKLRMAWSVGWGVVAVLLIALWVRSLTKFEYAQGVVFPRRMPDGRFQAMHLTIHSFDHVLSVIWATDRTRSEFPPWRFASRSWQATRESWKLTHFFHEGNLGGKQYQSPYWLLVVTTGALWHYHGFGFRNVSVSAPC
jgi:hypothetical protein